MLDNACLIVLMEFSDVLTVIDWMLLQISFIQGSREQLGDFE